MLQLFASIVMKYGHTVFFFIKLLPDFGMRVVLASLTELRTIFLSPLLSERICVGLVCFLLRIYDQINQ